ncbi:hypothetical protein K435DRAFT_968461 [Dendrothele bispora CBS 962.96]|uniref:Uncharacterized protein n=1 Tax=Dendrothele bispora (strain CBS 962.96) TaxID=1314807 RepID=A0A4V4HEE7_DENBC|nr:hypothetical protein K435DRAFT_968461 [Dendrothele bispora CBS 962.96]
MIPSSENICSTPAFPTPPPAAVVTPCCPSKSTRTTSSHKRRRLSRSETRTDLTNHLSGSGFWNAVRGEFSSLDPNDNNNNTVLLATPTPKPLALSTTLSINGGGGFGTIRRGSSSSSSSDDEIDFTATPVPLVVMKPTSTTRSKQQPLFAPMAMPSPNGGGGGGGSKRLPPPADPTQSTRASIRVARLLDLQREQQREDDEAMKLTEAQHHLLHSSFSSVNFEFFDLDGLSWTNSALKRRMHYLSGIRHAHRQSASESDATASLALSSIGDGDGDGVEGRKTRSAMGVSPEFE